MKKLFTIILALSLLFMLGDIARAQQKVDSLLLVHADSGFTIKSYPVTGNIDVDPALVKNRKFSFEFRPSAPSGTVIFICKDSLQKEYTRTEGAAPYSLFGDRAGKFTAYPWPSHHGYHFTLITNIYSGKNAGGTMRTATATVGFVSPPPPPKATVKLVQWSIFAYYIETEKGDSLVEHKSIMFSPVVFKNLGWPPPKYKEIAGGN